jgi:hypothetical protein
MEQRGWLMGQIAGITIIDVARDMGIEPNKQMMWSVGLVVVNIFKQRYGALPPKDLRDKTYEEGVHCFAIYPETFRAVIEQAFRTHCTEKARQLELFPRVPPPPGDDLHV